MAGPTILVVNSSGDVGGDVAMVLLGLPALLRAGYTVHVAALPSGPATQQLRALPGVKLHTLSMGGSDLRPEKRDIWPLRALESAAAVARLAALVVRERVEAIYTFDRTASMPVAYAVSLVTGRPLVYNAQNSVYLTSSALHRRVVRHASRLTVSSEQMRQRFAPHVRDPARIATVPNAIEIARYNPALTGAALRAELGIAPSDQVVLLAGRMIAWKGQGDLLRAAPEVLSAHPNTRFLFAGSDYGSGYQAELEALAERLGIRSRVHFLGYRRDLATVIAACDIATMPSHEEPFGLVALEAMAMRKPVVATRAGGVPEFLVDGEMGYLVQPGEPRQLAAAICKLLADPGLARRMGQSGRSQVERGYDAGLYGTRIVALFDDLLSRTTRQLGLA